MGSDFTLVDTKELQRRIDAADVVVLDVRREADTDADEVRITGAGWRDPEQLHAWFPHLPKNKPLALYCVRGGSVSRGVAEALAAKGREVLVLEGGLEAWKAAGGQTVPFRYPCAKKPRE